MMTIADNEAMRAAADALGYIGMLAHCAPNDDPEAAERELQKIMRAAYRARDALREAITVPLDSPTTAAPN